MHHPESTPWNSWFSFQPHQYVKHGHWGKCPNLPALRVSVCRMDKMTLEVPAFTVPASIWHHEHPLCARLCPGCWDSAGDQTSPCPPGAYLPADVLTSIYFHPGPRTSHVLSTHNLVDEPRSLLHLSGQ